MKKEKTYHGVVVPMVTPFTENNNIDETAAIRISDYLMNAGTIPFLLGTTGESASIPMAKRNQLMKLVADHVGSKKQLYAGISANCLENSILAAKQYFDYGVDACVAHLPSYYPLTPDHMLRYYEALAECSPSPIMIYNITITTHMSIPIDVIEKLSYHPNIIGIKDSERDMDRLTTFANLFSNRDDFSILIGWSGQSAKALFLGFDGIVPNPGNLIPHMYKKLYDAALNGDKNTAEKMQRQTDEIAQIFQQDKILSQVLPGLKVMMKELDLCEPYVKPPLSRLTFEEENKIKELTKKLVLPNLEN